MSSRVAPGDGSFTIFAGNKPWYSSDASQLPVEKKPKVVAKNRASAKGPPPIINGIFEYLSLASTDTFWKELFHKAALNDFPRGFVYFNGELSHKIRNKITTITVNQHPEVALNQVKRFMGETAAVMSSEDMKIAKMEEEQRLTKHLSEMVVTWSAIRNMSQRAILISHYALRVAEYYKLSSSEVDVLESTIKMGVASGYFNSDNITVVGGMITSIGCLIMSDKHFVIDLSKVKLRRRAANKDEDDETEGANSDLFMKNWSAIIMALKKKVPVGRVSERALYSPTPLSPMPAMLTPTMVPSLITVR